MTRVAVVGGGIAGLTAAHALIQRGVDAVVFEGSDRVGGKLRRENVGDVLLDVGAESILARRPEGLSLIDDLALPRVSPETTKASVWLAGGLRPLPRTILGIPAEPTDLVSVEQHSVPLPDHDISVAEYVRDRAGQEVLDRLVEPILGGVYAGDSSRLSLAAAAAQLGLLGADPVATAAQTTPVEGPVFAGIDGGVGRLAEATAEALPDVRTGVTVRGLDRGWTLRTSRGDEQFDAVIVATPAPATARLLGEVAPRAAFALADVTVASMAIVTLVFDADLDLPGSGFLVPPTEGRTIKAATFSSQKWGWLAEPGRTILRASIGRVGDTGTLLHDDATVVEIAYADLVEALGPLPRPSASHVQRWGGALPQYEVGHLAMLDVVDADVASVAGLEVCGATYRGVGIPAVIASAWGAVDRLLAGLGD